MSTPVGITVPKMLPITGTWSLPFTAYLILLSGRVVNERLKYKKWLGDDAGPEAERKHDDDFDPLTVANRAHANCLENVPLGLLLAGIVELNGGNRKVINSALAALLTFRIIHVEFGLMGQNSMSKGRPIGYWGTIAYLGGMAGYATYLVKGYWGF